MSKMVLYVEQSHQGRKRRFALEVERDEPLLFRTQEVRGISGIGGLYDEEVGNCFIAL